MTRARPLTLEWLGVTTFRVRVGGLTLFFDTFVDRIASAPAVGVRSAEIRDADFIFISHAHLDHILGADTIALNTGAPVIGSHETIRVMRENGVPAEQQWAVSGGETIECGPGVSVRVLPALHSCLWAASEADAGAVCDGDLGVGYSEQRDRTQAVVERLHTLTPEVEIYLAGYDGRASRHDGGQLNHLLTTPQGTILFCSSAGHWRAIMRELRPDVALLAVSGRPNVDGEPFQGSLAQFIAAEVELLAPRVVALCHHDEWMPPLAAVDVRPVLAELARRTPSVAVAELAIGEPVAILAG
jgi:L-ascorbate metabolism protein UlaG (beta-lactamase superfamily)